MGWQVYRNFREEWYYKAIATGVLTLSIFVGERCDEHLVKCSYDKHGLICSLQSSLGAQLSYERNEYGELICSPSYLLLLLRKDCYLYPQMIGRFSSWRKCYEITRWKSYEKQASSRVNTSS